MKQIQILTGILLTVSLVLYGSSAQAETSKWARLVEESGKVLSEVQKMPDQGIPDDLLRKCSAIAIFPSTVSAGFIIGGQYGQGIIMVRDEKTRKWSDPAIFDIVGGSVGFQVGGEATDLILLFMNRRSVDGVLQGRFKVGVDAAVAAGPVGRNAKADTDIQLKGGILSYSRCRGLFAGIRLDGAAINDNWAGNTDLYEASYTIDNILIENKYKMPKCAEGLLKTLDQYN
jgi:lipid-binding SYLF domain-containing protein